MPPSSLRGLVFCDIFPNYSPLHFYLKSSGEGEGEGNGVEAETNRRDNLSPEAEVGINPININARGAEQQFCSLFLSSNGGCHLRIQIKKYDFKVAVSR